VKNLPPAIAPGQTFTISPGSPPGTFVGLALPGGTNADFIPLTWQITGGTGIGTFAIESPTGVIRVANAAPLPTTGANYSLTLTVTDEFGSSAPTQLTIRAWPPDQDDDGMSDAFEQLHGDDPTGLSSTSDNDHDGLPALIEYACGLNPSQPNSTGYPVLATTDHGNQTYLSLTYRRSVSASPTVALHVRLTTDFLTWHADQTAPVSMAPAPGEPGIELVTVRSIVPLGSRPREFLRVEAIPLSP
jgi:hypothetical protein